MLVDAINSRRPTGATENTVLGPFHVADAPVLANGTNICLDQKGEPMVVRGRVTDVVTGKPLAGVKLGLFRNLDDAGGQNGVGCAHNRNTPLIRLQACPNTFSR